MWSRMTLRIKANRTSIFRGDMGCRYCKTDLNENQERLESCPGHAPEQRCLNLNFEQGKQIFWRRMEPKCKKLADENKLKELKEKLKLKKEEKAKKKRATTATKVTKASTKKEFIRQTENNNTCIS